MGDIAQGLSDELILAKAEREKRILITDDKDFQPERPPRERASVID